MTTGTDPKALRASIYLRAILPLVLIVLWGMASLIAIFTDTGQELYPPSSLANWAIAIGTGLGVLCLVQGLRQRPINVKLAATTIVASVLVAMICSMMTVGILDRIRESIVFRGNRMTAYESDLRVWSGSIDHYRGDRYRVVLRDYPGLFEIEASDYLSAFGRVERIHPNGYCVRVTVQRAGNAARILAKDGMLLPPGSLQRCAGPAGPLGSR